MSTDGEPTGDTGGTREGVIRFRAEHDPGPLPATAAAAGAACGPWRRVLRGLGWLGREAGRYGGFGYGNLSLRWSPGLLVSGTQTSSREELGADGWCLVLDWDTEAGRVTSRGPVLPSSEALSHAAVYDAVPGADAVVHVHAPGLWRAPVAMASTAREVEAGTPAMAAEIRRVAAAVEEHRRSTPAATLRVLRMGGHEDGLLSWGEDLGSAGKELVRLAVRCALGQPRGVAPGSSGSAQRRR